MNPDSCVVFAHRLTFDFAPMDFAVFAHLIILSLSKHVNSLKLTKHTDRSLILVPLQKITIPQLQRALFVIQFLNVIFVVVCFWSN